MNLFNLEQRIAELEAKLEQTRQEKEETNQFLRNIKWEW
jgi:BMFP domain-containing protein YqiC